MRHRIKRDTLSRTSPHRRSMMANMSASLLVHEQIKTTVPKAKLLRPFVERLITLSKKESLGSRRLALSRVRDQDAVRKLFATLGARYKNRNGGYCRIIRCGFRPGDNAPMAYIELVDRDTEAKGKEDKARHLEAQSARLDQQTVAS